MTKIDDTAWNGTMAKMIETLEHAATLAATLDMEDHFEALGDLLHASGTRGGPTTLKRKRGTSKEEEVSEARRAIRALCARRNATD